jgi:SAM-dependent methyltransferase
VSAAPKSVSDLLWAHLREVPAFRALIRTIEARLVREAAPHGQPILDLGCGDGHFAQVALGEADAGIDVDLAQVFRASRRKVYRLAGAGSAAALPFRDNSFGTVLANCAIEHMPDLDGVLFEVNRVLRPGGRFVFSVPTDRFDANLLLGRILQGLGLSFAAASYRRWFERISRHHHLYSRPEWRRRVEASGLKISTARDYLSPRATAALELGHFLGVPNLLCWWLLGKWVVWPWRPRFFVMERILWPLVVEDSVQDSSCCFFVAEKPGQR